MLSIDIEVEMTFLKTEEGGRTGPAFDGYRPQFFYEGQHWCAMHTYIGTDSVNPGDTVRAYLSFLSPEYHVGRIAPGMLFSICEGSRVIAKGHVLKIIDLAESAQKAISKTISPWADSAQKPSPDGRYIATVDGAVEIAMGAPTSGNLAIMNRALQELLDLKCCNPSFVWASDSSSLAIPQWNDTMQQVLVIIRLPSFQLVHIPQTFRVLQLHSFHNGIVRGVDSPMFHPREVEIAVPTSTNC